MNKFKGTPWPWFVSDEYSGIVVDSDGIRISAAYSDKPYEPHDARLIAAAPELLEALIEVVRISDRKHDAWDAAKHAIAKALGEQHADI